MTSLANGAVCKVRTNPGSSTSGAGAGKVTNSTKPGGSTGSGSTGSNSGSGGSLQNSTSTGGSKLFLGAVAATWNMNLAGATDPASASIWGGLIRGRVANFGGFTADPINPSIPTLQINYPIGSWTPSAAVPGGASFYVPIGGGSSYNKALLTYAVYFPADFDFVKGGKLPGLFGGDVTQKCSGGLHGGGCWSVRLMWRANGAGEAYSYLPASNDAALCDTTVNPQNICNPTYGNSLNRGAWTFAKGQWTTLSMYIQMNDVGSSNGILKVWANNILALEYDALSYRTDSNVGVDQLFFSTFFGGSDSSWASTSNTYTLYKDVSAILGN
ncbi:hypothetical protein SmJEL517_g04978 [Synchytrium microbalum]|uniref:Polysaccharide lyase 14 domain-containing protein n=1 Tax=Synchytrium microbalum TaxID=1806994 RepID=A0A507C134_9FUNG|nr:uncharacterized protein SmJEL517_g04978 [Synchytrium microbalum]TPX31774.1 hypothetical protein SmJEL517_g04978 [Synchytrium microbalum]